MKKPKLKITVAKEDAGYSAYAKFGHICIATQGDTLDELYAMALDAVNLSFEDLGYVYSVEEIQFEYDMASFFDFCKVINAKALSERIHMNQSLLAQYIKGHKKPSPKQIKRILNGARQIGKELTEVRFLL
ncbi:MAG: transcriptional regulator [Candidatus Nephrothrix sp. EaCA]|nr:MAG: transcriptional regulator [Candidatus Nephrothrix sp. EaCA]